MEKEREIRRLLLARKMYRQKLRCFLYIIYSNSRIPRYSCYKMCIMQCMTRIDKSDILRQYNDKFIYTLSRSTQNHRPPDNVRPAEGYIRISHNLLSPSPSPSPKTIEFIPSGAKTQKKEIIPYPRCGFGACLRCG